MRVKTMINIEIIFHPIHQIMQRYSLSEASSLGVSCGLLWPVVAPSDRGCFDRDTVASVTRSDVQAEVKCSSGASILAVSNCVLSKSPLHPRFSLI